MKPLRTIFAITAITLLWVASSAMAAPSIGVYFGANADVSTTRVQPNQQFKLSIVMTNINNQVNAVEYKLNLPSDLIVLNRSFTGSNAVDFGNPTDGVAVGLGDCVAIFDNIAGQERYVVEEYTVMSLVEFASTPVTLTPFTGGAQGGSVVAPRFSDCNGQLTDMVPLGGSLAASVGIVDSSWGAVKSLYE